MMQPMQRRSHPVTLTVAALLALGIPSMASSQQSTSDAVPGLLALVDPFVGTDGGGFKGGNTVPGAGVPFGFVSLSPDTTLGDSNGYDTQGYIIGFSHTHVSGTGGQSKFGNFRVTPTVGPVGVGNLAFERSDEVASPGHYAVTIGNTAAERVRVELTATRLTGFSRFVFPRNADGNVILDVTAAIPFQSRGQRATAAYAEFVDERTMSGWASFEGGVTPTPYKLYFYARLDRTPRVSGVYDTAMGSRTVTPGGRFISGGDQRDVLKNHLGAAPFLNRIGLYATFDTSADPVVQMKLAVSYVSVDQARASLDRESPGWDFAAARSAAEALWTDVLDNITVEGGSDLQRRLFYTGLYRAHTMPHDLTGESPHWHTDEPHYDQFFCLWDTFRTVHPLLTLIQPERQRDMVRALIDIYRHEGWLPDGRLAGYSDLQQGGTNADIVIADAIVKGMTGFDRELAYEAIRKNGMVESPRPQSFGRVLGDYLSLGYVSLSEQRSASRTVEYAYNDFAIAQVARALGRTEDAEMFLDRSRNWRNLWDPSVDCLRPRYATGEWQESFLCERRYYDRSMHPWDVPFYEGSARQYSTFVPHDVTGLIDLLGGPADFTTWLDDFFDGIDSPGRGHYYHGNEPDILASYLYIHAGRPDRTAERVRFLLQREYRLESTGLPGNDDAGTMSAWYVWGAIGLYPNAGQPFYYIGSPLFPRSTLDLGDGRTFTVEAPQTSDVNLYVVGARLNGRPVDRAWLTHAEVAAGGVLTLDMAATPGNWATRPTDPTAATLGSTRRAESRP